MRRSAPIVAGLGIPGGLPGSMLFDVVVEAKRGAAVSLAVTSLPEASVDIGIREFPVNIS